MNSASSRSPSRDICIIGIGAATPLGYNAAMTAASVRANLCRFRQSHVIDTSGEPMVLSIAEYIDKELLGADRLSALAVPALKEAMTPLLNNAALQKQNLQIPMFLGIAGERPGPDPASAEIVMSRLEAEAGIQFTRYSVIPTGHASVLSGIEMAVREISSRKAELALVGGVDSYYELKTLEWPYDNKRLHSDTNKDAFIPGEGAGFCLVASMDFARRYGLPPLAKILHAVSDEEPNPLVSDGVCIGEGLTRTLRRTLASLGEEGRADWTICDMNGESYRAMEWSFAYLRTTARHRDPLEIWHPADCLGDIGASSGAVLAGIAIAAWQRNYARGDRCLVWTSSDGCQRSAMLLKKPV